MKDLHEDKSKRKTKSSLKKGRKKAKKENSYSEKIKEFCEGLSEKQMS